MIAAPAVAPSALDAENVELALDVAEDEIERGIFFSRQAAPPSELARPILQFWAVQMRAFLAGCGWKVTACESVNC
jgi:hypothetical protein